MMILVTGAAGYVGSIVTEQLVERGHKVTVLDNLSQGYLKAIHHQANFVKGDLANTDLLRGLFRDFSPDAVIHMAAEARIDDSVRDPRRYFQANLVYGFNLLEAMLTHGVHRIVFSSTAAVYGEPMQVPIGEDDPKVPVNSYGDSKLMFERILEWYHRAYGFQVVCLRYFNACGASVCFGEHHEPETHLIPLILQVALGQRTAIHVFGADYDTFDGSCIRDYVHVVDLAQAHLLALENLEQLGCQVYNLGNGDGYSVLQVIQAAREVTGHAIPVVVATRRAGDPARLVASSDRVRAELGWQPRYPDLHSIIESAWRWHKQHPHWYSD